MNVDMDAKYKLADEVVARQNQDGTFVVMRLDDSNVFFKINGVAADVWKSLVAGEKVGDVLKNVLDEYQADEAQVKSDIEQFLSGLSEKNLIVKN